MWPAGEQISKTNCYGCQPASTDDAANILYIPAAAAAGACDVISIPASNVIRRNHLATHAMPICPQTEYFWECLNIIRQTLNSANVYVTFQAICLKVRLAVTE